MDDAQVRKQRALRVRELAAQITELAGHLNAANYRWLALIAEFDRCSGWSDGSTQSCAHWLNWQCGIDMGAAREKVRVAHALEKLPRIAAAMERGELSYSKARALTRVACEKTEEYFLSIALHGIAESFLQHGAEAFNGGDRYQIVVHVDAQTFSEGCAGRCELEDGPSLSVETVRRLACDANLVGILEDAKGEPLNVGRKTRSIPPALQRALNARDRGCRFPGCSNTRYVDAHHIHHWSKGGETKLSNLVQLCRFHHRQVHEGRVAVQILDDGALRFVRPDGKAFDSVAPDHTRPLSDWRQLPEGHQQRGIHIDKDTAATRWRGETMDYGLAIEVLLQHSHRGECVSAETRYQQFIAPKRV